MGEAKRKALKTQNPVAVDTFGGRVHVEWDPAAAVTPLGQLPFWLYPNLPTAKTLRFPSCVVFSSVLIAYANRKEYAQGYRGLRS